MERKVFGIPGPPSRIYTDHFGLLIMDHKRHEADHRRWKLALKACELIAEDRRAGRGKGG